MKKFKPPTKKKPTPQRKITLDDNFSGQCFSAEVLDLSSDGLGVVEHSTGLRVFVPGVCVGEKVEVKIVEHKGRWAFARLQNIEQKSSERIEPPCIHHGFGKGDCGACAWMFMSYSEQLARKQRRIEQSISKLQNSLNQSATKKPQELNQAIANILPAPKTLGYRQRAQFKTDGEHLGFVQQGSQSLADVEDCLVLSDHNRQSLAALRKCLPNKDWQPKRSSKKNKNWTTLDIDNQTSADQVSVNQRLPFQQANPDQNSNMLQWLQAHVSAWDTEASVLELFAGSGNFTQLLAQQGFKQILAVEAVDEALQALAAKQLAQVSGLKCDLFNELSMQNQYELMANKDYWLLDPPRDGFKELPKLMQHCGKKTREVLYISCDLATFTRDALILLQQGFALANLQPIDMFPQTPHIELMAHFKRELA